MAFIILGQKTERILVYILIKIKVIECLATTEKQGCIFHPQYAYLQRILSHQHKELPKGITTKCQVSFSYPLKKNQNSWALLKSFTQLVVPLLSLLERELKKKNKKHKKDTETQTEDWRRDPAEHWADGSKRMSCRSGHSSYLEGDTWEAAGSCLPLANWALLGLPLLASCGCRGADRSHLRRPGNMAN